MRERNKWFKSFFLIFNLCLVFSFLFFSTVANAQDPQQDQDNPNQDEPVTPITPTNNSSTSMRPTALTPEVEQTTLPAQPISNENYAALPKCNPPMVCPDIFGKLPPGQAGNCPDNCKVTRVVSGSGSSITTIDAVCPAGYAATANWNSQPEYKYYPNNVPGQYPIPDMETYNSYVSQGYDCTTSSDSGYSNWYCNGNPNYTNGQVLDQLSGTGGVVTQVIGDFDRQCFALGGCGRRHIGCGVAHDTGYRFYYKKMECNLAPGIRKTGNYIAASLVCTRVKTQFQPYQSPQQPRQPFKPGT